MNRLLALVDGLQPRVQLLVGFEHSLVLEFPLADVTDVRRRRLLGSGFRRIIRRRRLENNTRAKR